MTQVPRGKPPEPLFLQLSAVSPRRCPAWASTGWPPVLLNSGVPWAGAPQDLGPSAWHPQSRFRASLCAYYFLCVEGVPRPGSQAGVGFVLMLPTSETPHFCAVCPFSVATGFVPFCVVCLCLSPKTRTKVLLNVFQITVWDIKKRLGS